MDISQLNNPIENGYKHYSYTINCLHMFQVVLKQRVTEKIIQNYILCLHFQKYNVIKINSYLNNA